MGSWVPMRIDPEEFNLRATLTSGQAFRWFYCTELGEWCGVINGEVWRLRQPDDSRPVEFYSKTKSTCNRDQYPRDLVDYFRLDVSLDKLLQQWRKNDAQFAQPMEHSTIRPDRSTSGIRLLRQDPVETLFAYMTSANNNVVRITQLLMRLSQKFGHPIKCSGSPSLQHWRFPTLATLTKSEMEDELRKMGFGYRSKFLPAAARWIQAHGGERQLLALREASVEEARDFLLQIPGIGNKVADCICLSALDKINVVPVDVHMLRAARERQISAAVRPNLTPKTYRDISEALSRLWGEWAGWAQAIDFSVRLGASVPKRNRKRSFAESNTEKD